ncbi:MAG: ABC transporter ATP-binding protein [Candidatus Latescibacterota bacterium]|jgi:ABC-2 type transport system ATP-binding protein
MLSAIGLTKRYEDGVLALDNLNLTVSAGEAFCLLGANGAGKTTTINLMLDFIPPTDGTVMINGIDIRRDSYEARKHISYLSENVMLYGNFTARQNLDYFTRLGGRRGITREEYHACLRRVGLPEKAFEQRVKSFSKGMRQRLGIAIVIMKDAPVVIMDEPTSGLDPRGAADFVDLLKELRDRGKAIFTSTHHLFRAQEFADRLGIMKEGRLVMVRTREELEHEDLQELYLNYMRAA